MHARAQHPGGDVTAHVGAHSREAIHNGLRMHVQAQLGGTQRGKAAGGRDVGFQPDVLGLQPEEEVDHGGVAGHRRHRDLLRRQALARQHLVDEGVDGRDHAVLQFLAVLGLPGVDDAGDDVLAAGDLAVVGRGMVHELATLQITQVRRHAGGADVDGQAQDPCLRSYRVARPAGGTDPPGRVVVAALYLGGDGPLALAQDHWADSRGP